MKRVTEVEHHPIETAAYLGGILDGEGCIFIGRRHYSYSHDRSTNFQHILELSITNNNGNLMKWLWNHGWYVRPVRQRKIKEGWRKWYSARITHRKARDLLVSILPYLIIKKEEALLAIEFQNHKDAYGTHRCWRNNGLDEKEIQYREFIRNQLKELKRKEVLYETKKY